MDAEHKGGDRLRDDVFGDVSSDRRLRIWLMWLVILRSIGYWNRVCDWSQYFTIFCYIIICPNRVDFLTLLKIILQQQLAYHLQRWPLCVW